MYKFYLLSQEPQLVSEHTFASGDVAETRQKSQYWDVIKHKVSNSYKYHRYSDSVTRIYLNQLLHVCVHTTCVHSSFPGKCRRLCVYLYIAFACIINCFACVQKMAHIKLLTC